MPFVLVDHGDSSATTDESGVVDVPLHPFIGHYRPAAAATGARALRWLPLAAAVSATRALLGASHEDLRLRAHQLSRALSEAFFFPRAAAADDDPFIAAGGGGARFPEGGLYVCADVQPLARAVLDVQRALVRIVVEEARYEACDLLYDVVRDVMALLVGEAQDGRGPAVFDRDKFESAFKLEWIE